MTLTGLPPRVAAALENPIEPDRITVEATGIRWSALVWGEPGARPVLLIHGVTASAAVWWRVGPALAASGRRATAVDQAGHGLTGRWQGHTLFRDNAADIAAFARAAGLATDDLEAFLRAPRTPVIAAGISRRGGSPSPAGTRRDTSAPTPSSSRSRPPCHGR